MEARRAPRKQGRGEERSDFYAALVMLWCFDIRLWQLSWGLVYGCGDQRWFSIRVQSQVVWYTGSTNLGVLAYELSDSRWFGIRVERFLVARYTGLAILWSLGSAFGGTQVFDIGHGEKEEWLAMVLEAQRDLYVIETTVFARLIASSK
jgi:hypothetical protein